MIVVQSVQVGKITTEGSGDAGDITSRHWTTGFYKRPTSKVVKVTADGMVGDQVADRKNHGGPDKAVLCYCAEHCPKWAEQYPQMSGQFGGFGENLTLSGADAGAHEFTNARDRLETRRWLKRQAASILTCLRPLL